VRQERGPALARGLPDKGGSGAKGAKMRQYVSIRRNGALAEAPTTWLLLGILVPAAAFLAALWLQPWVPVANLIDDGVLASVESLLWVGTAAICLFTAAMIHAAQGNGSPARFLLVAGLVTLWLGLDDVLAIHGEVLPSLGAPQALAATAYAAIGAVYLLASWRTILRNRPTLLLAAALLLGASLRADLFASETPGDLFAEAGLRFLAIAFWAGFHVAAAARFIEELATGRITAVSLSSERLVRKAA
jgi:hypothetical protein